MNSANLMDTQTTPASAEAIPSHEMRTHQFFAEHAKQNGQTLQPGDWGFPLQENTHVATAKDGDPTPLDEDAQRSVDEALSAPASLSEYRIPSVQTGEPSPEIMAEVKATGAWMRDAGLPAPIGHAIATEMFKLSALQPSEGELTRMSKQLHHDLQRSWGDRYQANLDAAMRLINEVDAKHGGKVWQYLDRRPAMLSSPAVVKMLSLHARRVYGML